MERKASASEVRWRIGLLGGLRAEQEDRVIVRFQRHKTGAGLAYLAYHLDRAHRREALCDLFWPDSDLSAGRQNLSQALSWLRRELESASPAQGEVILADRLTVRLNPAVVTTDVAEFQAALQAAKAARAPAERIERLSAAAALYQGELLPGFYEDWVLSERESLAESYLKALGQLVDLLEQSGDLEGALEHARRAVSVDPLREDAHQRLIRLTVALGRPAEARRRYQELERIFQEELGVAPSEESRRLLEQIRSGVGSGHPAPNPPTHNLPASTTSFIGREREMAEVRARLDNTRLLTLTGPGGCGKSRLALQMAAGLLEEYPDGVWLMELAALSDPALVAQALVAALNVTEAAGAPLAHRLVETLKARQLLLILDNCEHLLEACARLSDALLRGCPQLKIIATSREALGLSGEAIYGVPSLGFPEPGERPPLERLIQYDAVQLFIERAEAKKPGFALTARNGARVAEVCRRLDGIPLGLELAAALVRALPIEQIAGRLDSAFRLLTGGSRTALPRHQTLQATIDWSYNLLSDGERTLLRRLPVFAGGWTVEAAEQVCGGVGERAPSDSPRSCSTTLPSKEILGLLTSLVDKSLVVYDEGRGRYRLLEMVRQYAWDRLRDSEEEAAVRDWHVEHFLHLAEEAYERCQGPEQGEWLDRLEAEHDNLRAALAWSGQGDGERQVRLAGALGEFWEVRGYYREGLSWLEQALAHEGTAPRWRARALEASPLMLELNGRAGEAWLEEAVELYRQAGDEAGVARSLACLSVLLKDGGQIERALAMANKSVELARTQGDRLTLARVLRLIGPLGLRPLLEEALALSRELRHPAGVVIAAGWLGCGHLHVVDTERDRPLLEEALARSREIGYKHWIVNCQRGLGLLDARTGDEAGWIARLEESVALLREGWNYGRYIEEVADLARALLRRGETDYAQRLLEEAIGQVPQPATMEIWDWLESLVHFRSLLGYLMEQRGDREAAQNHAEEALRLTQEAPEDKRVHCLGALGHAAREFGAYEQARTFYAESLRLRRKLDNRFSIAQSLEDHGVLSSLEGKHERAARLFGAAEALAATLGQVLPVAMEEDYHRAEAASRAALGEAAFAAPWAEGRAMSLEQAIACALAPSQVGEAGVPAAHEAGAPIHRGTRQRPTPVDA